MMIVAKSGPVTGRRFEIDRELVLGREADLSLDDPQLSRRHLRLRPVQGGVEIEDLGSTNGTFVDDQRIDGVRTLRPGDRLRLGSSQFALEAGARETVAVSLPGPPARHQAAGAAATPFAPSPGQGYVAPGRRRGPLVALVVVLVLIAGVVAYVVRSSDDAGDAVVAGAGAPAASGFVYVETNAPAPAGNEIQVFARAADGSLVPGERYPTRGDGKQISPPLGLPLTDSQGAVALSPDGRVLFAVNTGSNTVSTFLVDGASLTFVSTLDSGGEYPLSVTASANGVGYVANVDPDEANKGSAGKENLVGFRYDTDGRLSALAGAVYPLTPRGLPATIAFSPSGTQLVVTERESRNLLTFPVAADGTLGERTRTASPGVNPFGLAITRSDVAIVSDFGDPGAEPAIGSSVSSYTIAGKDSAGINSYANRQLGSCWVALSPDDTVAYVTSAVSQSVTAARVGPDGSVTALETKAPKLPGFGLDAMVSPDGKNLYVLEGTPKDPASLDRVMAYRIEADGTLTPLGEPVGELPANASGLVAT